MNDDGEGSGDIVSRLFGESFAVTSEDERALADGGFVCTSDANDRKIGLRQYRDPNLGIVLLFSPLDGWKFWVPRTPLDRMPDDAAFSDLPGGNSGPHWSDGVAYPSVLQALNAATGALAILLPQQRYRVGYRRGFTNGVLLGFFVPLIVGMFVMSIVSGC